MGYQDPNQVKSPKTDVSHLNVLYDGGEQTADHGEWEGWSIAELEWQEKPVLACRWNGSTDNAEISQVGNPQSRRYPIWFILPKPLEEAIRARLREAPACPPKEIPVRLAAALSSPAFVQIWNNPEDDVYDAV
jgi:hypothetical protein